MALEIPNSEEEVETSGEAEAGPGDATRTGTPIIDGSIGSVNQDRGRSTLT